MRWTPCRRDWPTREMSRRRPRTTRSSISDRRLRGCCRRCCSNDRGRRGPE
jgi:hypothetical protein